MLKGSKQKALSANKKGKKELAQSASGAKDTNISQQPSAIELLSDEILCAIFGCLDDGIDLCAVGLVSQAWRRLAHDDTLWKGLAVKRGWALPGGGAEAEAGAGGEDSSSHGKATAAAKGGKRSKDHQRHRPRASLQRAKAKLSNDDSYLTKGRTVDDDDDNNDYRDGDDGGVGGGRWKEWYVQTLHRRVKRSMRECGGDDEEARWRHIIANDADNDDNADGDERDSEDDDGDGDGDDDVGKRQLRREAQNRREAAEERVGSSGKSYKVDTAASSREDFVQLVKEKAARSLTKVEIREQEVVLAQFAWDTPVQQFGANKDDLYIVGGTPWGLVNYMLTELSSLDDPMVTQFLLTHQSFVSSVEVLRMLEEYLCIMPRGYSRDYQLLWRKHKLAPVQNMVVHVVKCWIKEQPCHFRTDPVLAARMQEFLESHLTFHPLEKAFHQLLQQYIAALKPTDPLRRVVITPRVHSAVATATAASTASTEGKENDKEKGKEKESGEKSDEGEPEAGGGEGPNWRLIDLHKTSSKKIARQMALIAFDLFAQLPHDELLNMRWKHQPSTCPNVRQLVDFFNMVAGYVATTIVMERSMKPRVKMLEKWVDIANHSFKIQDLTSTLAIVSGLGCAAVHRLKKTRQNMSKSAVKTLEALTQMSTRRRLRALAETMTPPGVPYLGMHLVDLSFVSDGYTPFLNMDWGDKTCVHWYYHCMNALVIKEMQGFIKTGFHFKRDPALIETLCSLPYLATEDAYRHSLTVDETIEQ